MPRPIKFQLPNKPVTEIRIHGVGGTPPEDLLGHPNPIQVAGDERAGFFRHPDPPKDRDIEAYSWGGLTSRNVFRSLWLLLLPFTLVNVAGWMVEVDPTITDKSRRQWHAEAQERLIRVLATLITCSAVVWASAIFVDLIAYQCGTNEACREGHWWLEFLGRAFFDTHPVARVTLGLIPPLALLGLLALLGRSSRNHYDRFDPFGSRTEEAGDQADLGSKNFWYRPTLAGDLAGLHGAAALWLLAALFAYTLREFALPDDRGWMLWIFGIALGLAILCAAGTGCLRPCRGLNETKKPIRFAYPGLVIAGGAAVLALGIYAIWHMPTVKELDLPRLDAFGRGPFFLLLLEIAICAAIGLIQFGWWLVLVRLGRANEANRPRVAIIIAIVLAAIFGAVVVTQDPAWIALVGAGALEYVRRHRFSRVVLGALIAGAIVAVVPFVRDGNFENLVPAQVVAVVLTGFLVILAIDHAWKRDAFRWGGMAILSLLGVLILAGAFTGIASRVADFLNKERTTDELGTAAAGLIDFQLPQGYQWFAVAFAGSLIITAIGTLLFHLHTKSEVKKEPVLSPGNDDDKPDDDQIVDLSEDETKKVEKSSRKAMTLARTAGAGDLVLTLLAGVTALAVLAGAVDAMRGSPISAKFWRQITMSGQYSIPEDWTWLFTISSWILAALPLLFLGALRRAYSDQAARRQLGILWDLGTFWPRRFHPLAPPSYAERAVPELQQRIVFAANAGHRVVLAAHSQGSIVAYAALESYAPLTKKGAEPTEDAETVTESEPTSPDLRKHVALATYGSPLGTFYRRFFPTYFKTESFSQLASELEQATPTSKGWRNFYRPTDPIGGPVFTAPPFENSDDLGRDVKVPDPWWWWFWPAQPLPQPLGHSDYMDDPVLPRWIEAAWAEPGESRTDQPPPVPNSL